MTPVVYDSLDVLRIEVECSEPVAPATRCDAAVYFAGTMTTTVTPVLSPEEDASPEESST